MKTRTRKTMNATNPSNARTTTLTGRRRHTATGYAAFVGITALVALMASPASAQEPDVCEGNVTGDLGVASYRCSGPECVMRYVRVAPEAPSESRRVEGIWRYSTEPTVAAVRPGAAVRGILREGDRIVSVNGSPITTLEGSRELQLVEPGERVRLVYRRDGALREAEVVAGSRCVEDPEEPALAAPAPPAEVSVQRPRGQVSLPRPGNPGRLTGDVVTSRVANGGVHLGMSFRCGDCVFLTDEEGGVRWSFTGPVEIVRVEEGGPAERAGLRSGDLVRRIDGHPVESREGAAAWGSLTSGEPVRVAVSRPDGSFANVELVPEERTDEPSTVTASGRVQYAPPTPAAPAVPPAPVRYTGVLKDIGIEVRGAPVTVDKDEGAGTITIYTGDNVIVIRTGRGG